MSDTGPLVLMSVAQTSHAFQVQEEAYPCLQPFMPCVQLHSLCNPAQAVMYFIVEDSGSQKHGRTQDMSAVALATRVLEQRASLHCIEVYPVPPANCNQANHVWQVQPARSE